MPLLKVGKALVLACACAGLALPVQPAKAQSTVTVAVTSDFSSWNPIADSTAQMFGIWCQVYGCLLTYDADKADFSPMLAESWAVDPVDRNKWTFKLRKGLKRHVDGKELSAEDVAHTINRINTDKQSAQRSNVATIDKVVPVDQHTFQIITKEPTADLLDALADKVIVTGKDLHDKHGARDADRRYPFGWGPYMVKDIVVGQRMVLEKNKDWPGIKKENPDRLIFVRIREAEVRLTGLLNGEIQIAQLIPPHLLERTKGNPNVKFVAAPPVEGMFLAMNPKFKPWDNKLARQAVAYAIDRDLIIKTVFSGYAEKLQGPVGKGQIGWSPDVGPKYEYDPKKARALLEQAGLVGTEVELFTTVNRYMYDREAAEAMIPMLEAAGFKATLQTPEYSVHWPQVQKGNRAFYYHGRGSMIDPMEGVSQYFQTGVSPRIGGYSNKELDQAIEQARGEFDPEKRKKLLQRTFSIIQEDVPAWFVWRINVPYGVSAKIDYMPTPHNRVYGVDIIVK